MKPGPAESRFGITAAPMAAFADWHGRVLITGVNLRGDIAAACRRMRSLLAGFDRKKASRPLYEVPEFAKDWVRQDGHRSLLAWRQRKRPVARIAEVYRGLDLYRDVLQFAGNLVKAWDTRVPRYGKTPEGYEEEVALLEELTFCANDRVKFMAIAAYGRFAPVGKAPFLVKRAEQRGKGCRNPNVVLCHCLQAIGEMATRFPGFTDKPSAKDHRALIDTLPLLTEVLDREGRNNSACARARDAVRAVAEATGDPAALGAYLHCFASPGPKTAFMERFTKRFHEASLPWLVEVTGENHKAVLDAWQKWFDEVKDDLVWRARPGRFVVNARAARKFRARLQGALE